ncbi:hypothetical protein ACGFIY_23775 [Micromonospora chersina]|uniref:hypothetical protein n=1 Tax=Micromonospora chersina TaxID=47854 RepID=UPI003717DAA3
MGPILGSLLPGLREVRAPLAAGYLWIAYAWLALRNDVPQRKTATGLLADVYDLAAWLGKPGIMVIVGFTAYLIGVVSVGATTYVLRRLSHLALMSRNRADLVLFKLGLSVRGVEALKSICYTSVVLQLQEAGNHAQILSLNPEAAAVVKAFASKLSLEEKRAMVAEHVKMDNYFEAVADDFQALPVRLMLDSPEAFSTYDRTRTEGEFRGAVVLPITAIALGVYQELTILSLGLLAAALALAVQARQRIVQANDEIAEVLRASGGKESPAVRSIVASTIEFTHPELKTDEFKKIEALAVAVEPVQPFAAISWYEILAATGSREANERLCDLTREHQDGLALRNRLGEGSQYSGRLAVEFVAHLYDEGAYHSPEGRDAIVRGLVRGYKDPDWRDLCRKALIELYFGPRPSANQDLDSLISALDRAAISPASLEVFIREWSLKPGATEAALSRFVADTNDPSRIQRTRRIPFPVPSQKPPRSATREDGGVVDH